MSSTNAHWALIPAHAHAHIAHIPAYTQFRAVKSFSAYRMEAEIEDDRDNDLTLFLTMVESWKHFINLTHDFPK